MRLISKISVCFLICINITLVALASPNKPTATKYHFVENKGQWPTEILFKADIPGGFLFFTNSGIQYYFYNPDNSNHAQSLKKNNLKIAPNSKKASVSFGSNINKSQIIFEKKLDQTYNYFLGNDPSKWKKNVGIYEQVIVKNIYSKIDLRIYNLDQSLKYEYIISPGGNPENISQTYEGFNSLRLVNNNLELDTGLGIIKEFEPFSLQKINSKTNHIKSSYLLQGNILKFEIANYDKTKELIIDPELVFSTFSGSISDNWSHSATYDSQGNLFAAGSVFGPYFQTTNGAYQQKSIDNFSALGLETDIIIIKYSSDGKKILYSTFLGGSDSEVPHSLIVNSKDELVIFGTTSSKNFPTSGYDNDFNGGTVLDKAQITSNILYANGSDIFVSVLSIDGSELKGSTYLGGNGNDGLHDFRNLTIQNYGDEFRGEVIVDAKDNIYVASITNSENFPILKSSNKKSSFYDAVVFEFTPYCKELVWSTYLGGNDYDAATGIRVSNDNSIYVCGISKSSNLNPNSDAYSRTFGGLTDAFIFKYTNYEVVKKTYLGTEKGDLGLFLDLDKTGNVYIFGLTEGRYPISSNVYNIPKSGQFIHCLNSDLTKSIFSTVIGTGRDYGKVDIVPTAFLVNDCNNIYLAGWGGVVNTKNGYNPHSTTIGLPITKDAYRSKTTGSNYYFAILEAQAKSLLYATYFGSESPPNPDNERGDHLDGGTCRFDKKGTIYHSACICKSEGFLKFPLENSVEPNHNNDNCNMGAFKFELGILKAKFDINSNIGKNPTELCSLTRISLENTSSGASRYQWLINNILISTAKELSYTVVDTGIFEVKLKVFNNLTCNNVDSTFRKFKVVKIDTEVSKDTAVCSGSKIKLFASGGISYTWSPEKGLSNSQIFNPIATINEDIIYNVQIATAKCIIDKKINIKSIANKPDFIVSSDIEICKGQNLRLIAMGNAQKFIWSAQNMPDSIKNSIHVAPVISTTYQVKAVYPDGCEPIKFVRVKIDDKFASKFNYSYEYNCNTKPKLILNNESVNWITKKWIFENINVSEDDDFIKQLNSVKGIQKITLKVKNEVGCENESSQFINLSEYDGLIPNVITPNGDLKNDTFVIGLPNIKIQIFNKSGKLIYISDKYANNWGNDVDSGQYYYSIKLTDSKICKGWIQVIK